MNNEMNVNLEHRERVIAKITSLMLKIEQETLNHFLNVDGEISLKEMARVGVKIDQDLLRDLLTIQLGRNAHKIASNNEK